MNMTGLTRFVLLALMIETGLGGLYTIMWIACGLYVIIALTEKSHARRMLGEAALAQEWQMQHHADLIAEAIVKAAEARR